MAIFHCPCKIIARGKGRTAVGAAAYRSGTKLTNEYDGVTHDFTKKVGVVHTEVILCENAPKEWNDREKLWNAVEKVEKAKDNQLAREFEIALPRELNREEYIEFARNYVKDNFVSKGMCADIGVHDKEDGNPHAHIMLTMRPIDENGKWEYKYEKIYICKNHIGEEKELTATELKTALEQGETWEKQLPYYKNGNVKNKPVYITSFEKANNPKYENYKRIKGKNNPKKVREDKLNPKIEIWNSTKFLNEVRADLADRINRELERKGLPQRVDHRSYAEQGVEQIPTIHVGAKATIMERIGKESDRGNINREIKRQNAELKKSMQEIHNNEKIVLNIKDNIKIVQEKVDYQINPLYRRQAEQIENCVRRYNEHTEAIKNLKADLSKLGLSKKRQKVQLQYEIGKKEQLRNEKLNELKALGVSDISQADKVIQTKRELAEELALKQEQCKQDEFNHELPLQTQEHEHLSIHER